MGITTPKGFMASSGYAGIGDPGKNDIGLIYSEEPCVSAAVYTKNKVKGAHIGVMRDHLSDGTCQAVICNSGNANTCTRNGKEIAGHACETTGSELGIDPSMVLPASTGIIGVELSKRPFDSIIPGLVSSLTKEPDNGFSEAIMTTDTHPKEDAVSFDVDGVTCTIGACAKGSGMIHINIGTMLSFMTTDLAITGEMLEKALKEEVKDSYNQVSVDGDTSTNDTLVIMANGLAGNPLIDKEGGAFDRFREALHEISVKMAKLIAGDGEGCRKLLEAHVKGAPSKEAARKIASSVISSDLVKTAIFGEDANWGRVLCAIGYTDADFSADNIDVDLCSVKGSIPVCRGSFATGFDEDEALSVLKEEEVTVEIDLNQGEYDSYAWGCDLTYDYVKINGEYRT